MTLIEFSHSLLSRWIPKKEQNPQTVLTVYL